MTTPLGHGHCWAEHPSGASHCTLDRGHGGDTHYNWFADRGTPQREWPVEEPTQAR